MLEAVEKGKVIENYPQEQRLLICGTTYLTEQIAIYLLTLRRTKFLCRSPKATDIIARRESPGYVERTAARWRRATIKRAIVRRLQRRNVFYCRPGDSRRAIMSVAVGDKNQNRVRWVINKKAPGITVTTIICFRTKKRIIARNTRIKFISSLG